MRNHTPCMPFSSFSFFVSQSYTEAFYHRSHCGEAMCRTCCSFIFLIALLLPPVLVKTAENPDWICIGGVNPANSTFSHNLQQALASLVANVSLTGYYNVTVGKSPNQVIAAVQCRGDIDGEVCDVCVSVAASQVTLRCPRNRVVAVVLQSCFMYVTDPNFTIPRSFMNVSFQTAEAIPDPERFKPMLTSFFNNLIISVTTNPSGRLYWGDSFRYTQNLTVYAMAQCLQNLTPKSCRPCLDEALAIMLKDATDTTSSTVFHNIECGVGYDIFPFFTPPPHKIAPSSAISISTSCFPPPLIDKVSSPFHRNLKALLSPFHRNLKALLNNYLIVYAPFPGFYDETVGLGSSQVYGQALCRGDITKDVCWHCIAQASTKIQELCPNSRRAIIWLDLCHLRYSDENFAGTVDVQDRACQPSAENTSNPTSFDENLRILFSNLTSKAVQSSSTHFFATGKTLLPDSQTIYALVQCVRDISADQCVWCLRNASADIEGCFNGRQGGRILRGSCSLSFGMQSFFAGDPALVSSVQPNHGYRRRWMLVLIGFIGGLLLTAAFAFCLVEKLKQHLEKLKQKETTLTDTESAEENETTFDLPQISLRTIQDATDKFSESKKLGEGGYGPVYKGKLPDGQEVAVKRLSGRSRQGLKQFRNEVESMAKLQHTNLVRLIGCCSEKGEKLLIYEYMPNKSLDFILRDPRRRASLDWEKRFNIIIGIARGMLYLHQDSRLNIIHRDLKASNVLLDEQLHPKISDFGLARIFSGVQGHATTSVIVGTYGYMAPEYAMDGVFSTKSDVYSFGILLLEIISGQLNAASFCVTLDESRSLVERAWSLWCEEKGTEFIDPVLKDTTTSTADQMLRCLQIGLLCIEEDAATRPTMSTVLIMLGNNSLDLPVPTQPAFIMENATDSSRQRSYVFRPVAYEIATWSVIYKKEFSHRSQGGGKMWRTACCFIFLIVLFLPLGFVDMTETPFWYCAGSSNYTANSTFSHNLQRALASVVANVSLTSFYNVTVGKSPDQALATAQCRGDLDGEACQVCVSDAASQVAELCPQNRAAIIFFESCIMYCRDANFTVPQSFMNLSLPRLEAIPDPQRFRPILISFFNKLILSTTTNPSGRLFWGDMFRYTQNLTIYATAQCVQYLSPKGCRSCLDIAFAQMLKNFGDRQGGVVYHNIECLVRFEPFSFFTPPPQKIDPNNGASFSSNCSQPTSSNKVGTPFHKNLKALLSYLIENAPLSGFYNDNVGLGSGQVYGQALCRGDIPNDVCWHCTAQASSKIQELCPNSRRAIIWLDHCQLRYSDEKFGGMADVSDGACQPAEEKASNPASFYQNLRILISNLTSLAMQSSSNHFFATGMSVIPDSHRIYALVQCVGDIPVDRCRWCLQNASSDIEDCSNGRQGARLLRGSCIVAFGVHPFFSGDPTLVSLPQTNHGNKLWWIVLLICLTGGLLLVAACALCLVRRRKQHLEKLKQKEATSIDIDSVKENEEVNYDLPRISLRTIEDATDKFSESNKLGEGGYGPVYKGKLPNGQEVAVKRLSGRSGQGLKEFKNEVELIVKLQHVNLVRLIALCLEKGEKMLIYEYMPNKSLDFFLKDPESRVLLDWEKRFNIIIGIAKGILYLHQDSRLNVIHRDLKANNVLLDEQLNPKISDFGLARIFSGVQGQATTSIVVGTYGYMAPEYAMDGVFSTKSDVYSFGILLFEIISGQLNSESLSAILLGRSLVEHAWSLWCEEKGTEFIDPVFKDAATSTSNQMLRCLHIGFLCIQEDPATRPTMSTVVLMLGNDSVDLPLPKQPASFGENVADSSQRCSSVITSVASEITTK
ncbi:uncharacterized protein LOC116263662 [Nymphaea colorata]|nr:uncharacterized protein LOC116263662 [Nymphaea colorata]